MENPEQLLQHIVGAGADSAAHERDGELGGLPVVDALVVGSGRVLERVVGDFGASLCGDGVGDAFFCSDDRLIVLV